jgi:S1-C subfamily serine protease
MKLMGAILIVLLAVLQVAAQTHDAGSQPGAKASSSGRERIPAPAPPGRELPLADRIAIEFALAWTGEYGGLIDGEFDERTVAAIKTFQRDRKLKETGLLTPQERALLSAAAKAKQAHVGWTIVDDSVTGARLGVPTKQAPIQSHSKRGTRWSSTQGQVQIETFEIREPGTTLASVHEQMKKEPPSRRLSLNVLRQDFFVLAGMQNLKKFHVRADIREGEVRGMTVLYDQAADTIMDAVAVAMAGTFAAFPAFLENARAAAIGPLPRRKVEYGTGIVVSAAGHILTDRTLTDDCSVILVGGYGGAERIARDETSDLALLRIYGERALVPAAFTSELVTGGDLTLVGIADPQSQAGGSTASTVAAKLKGDSADPAPPRGFSGAAALDRQGRPVGMVGLRSPVIATADPASAPQAVVVPAHEIRAFLHEHELAGTAARNHSVETAKASLVRVICVRK